MVQIAVVLTISVLGFILDGFFRFKKAHEHNVELNEFEMLLWIFAYSFYTVALLLYDCLCLVNHTHKYQHAIIDTLLILNFLSTLALYKVLRKHEQTLMDMINLQSSINAVLVISEKHSTTSESVSDMSEFRERLRQVMHQTGLLESTLIPPIEDDL